MPRRWLLSQDLKEEGELVVWKKGITFWAEETASMEGVSGNSAAGAKGAGERVGGGEAGEIMGADFIGPCRPL